MVLSWPPGRGFVAMQDIDIENLSKVYTRPYDGKEGLVALAKIKEGFDYEVGRIVGHRSKAAPPWKVGTTFNGYEESEEDSSHGHDCRHALGSAEERSGQACIDGDEIEHTFRACVTHVRNSKLAGLDVTAQSSAMAKTPGYGKGVPPVAVVEQCAIITVSGGRSPVILTVANDATNILWAPDANWDHAGIMSFLPAPPLCRMHKGNVFKGHTSNFDASAKATRAQAQREAEALRREEEAAKIQNTHLDLERDHLIKKELHTTAMQSIDFSVTKRVYAELEEKRLLFGLPEAGDPIPAIPNTPRALLEMRRRRQKAEARTDGKVPCNSSGTPRHDTTLPKRRNREAAAMAVMGCPHCAPTVMTPRQSPRVTCLATSLEYPRVVAGVAGQLVIYHFYREHGQRRTQLHQTQVFDASRQCGDMVTALHLPFRPPLLEGLAGRDVVVAGFESGRVAIFEVFLPEALQNRGVNILKHSGVNDEAERIAMGQNQQKSGSVSATEPLCLEHYHCRKPIVNVFLHPSLGILSISTNGVVLMVDPCGTVTCSIVNAAGHCGVIASADLSLEHEQLAVAGQNRLFLWHYLSQSKCGVLDAVSSGALRAPSPVLLVRYLPSQNFLFSVHKVDGIVIIWDTQQLELHHMVRTPDCFRATCAAWDSAQKMLYLFGPTSVTEEHIEEKTVSKSCTSKRGQALRCGAMGWVS